MGRVDCHYVFRALHGGSNVCGDIGIVKVYDNHCFLGLVDGLGHGTIAYEVACRAYEYLDINFDKNLVTVMQGLHEHLKGTRGGVAALCRINVDTGDIRFVGVGNITVKILGPRAATFVSRDGLVGYILPTPSEQSRTLYSGDILVMYSDGIKEHFDPLNYPGLLTGNAEDIASGMLSRLGKKDDDASCIALRYHLI